MLLSNQIKEKISIEVIKTLITRFESFPENATGNRNAPFHEAFLNAFSRDLEGRIPDIPFFITLSSWLHGLNTTLGQMFFENVAHILCNGEKCEYTAKRSMNLPILTTKSEKIDQIMTDLSNSRATPDLNAENAFLFEAEDDSTAATTSAPDFSADVFFEDNDGNPVAIELKSVKPNSGEVNGEKRKILNGKAALFRKFNRPVRFYIGFPFDPNVDRQNGEQPISHNKQRFFDSIINMKKFFAQEETLLAGELWDFLSEQNNTMQELLDIINAISTPNFKNEFNFLRDTEHRRDHSYIETLRRWNLFSEQYLIENLDVLESKIGNDFRLKRKYKQKPFKNNGDYNFDRYNSLKVLLTPAN